MTVDPLDPEDWCGAPPQDPIEPISDSLAAAMRNARRHAAYFEAIDREDEKIGDGQIESRLNNLLKEAGYSPNSQTEIDAPRESPIPDLAVAHVIEDFENQVALLESREAFARQGRIEAETQRLRAHEDASRITSDALAMVDRVQDEAMRIREEALKKAQQTLSDAYRGKQVAAAEAKTIREQATEEAKRIRDQADLWVDQQTEEQRSALKKIADDTLEAEARGEQALAKWKDSTDHAERVRCEADIEARQIVNKARLFAEAIIATAEGIAEPASRRLAAARVRPVAQSPILAGTRTPHDRSITYEHEYGPTLIPPRGLGDGGTSQPRVFDWNTATREEEGRAKTVLPQANHRFSIEVRLEEGDGWESLITLQAKRQKRQRHRTALLIVQGAAAVAGVAMSFLTAHLPVMLVGVVIAAGLAASVVLIRPTVHSLADVWGRDKASNPASHDLPYRRSTVDPSLHTTPFPLD